MPFLSISLTNFRNLKNGTIDLLNKEVYFIGDNGQGKSNLLESLYLSAYGNSFRTNNDAEMVHHGEDSFSVRSIFRDERNHTNSISVFFQKGNKKIEKNAKQIHDRKELVDTIPCVLFSHEDLDFSAGSPDRKRFFIDQSLSMYDSSYIDLIRQYKKILKTRNNLLKEKEVHLLDVLDSQLAEKGFEVIKRRERTIYDFNRIFARMYEEVSSIDNVKIDYSPSWKHDSVEKIMVFLAEKRNSDLLYGTSMSGPHRDHVRFTRNQTSFVPTASTGQRRLLSLLLRTSQAQFYTEVTGKKPVLLMDDVMLELDPDKRHRFTAILPEYDQLFCTFLPGEPFDRYKKIRREFIIYRKENGVSEQFRKASEIVAALFSGMEQESLERSNKLVSGWKEIVGPKISAHSRILDLDKNNLIVEVDHPGWSQQILLSKKNIIRSLSRNFPELIIKNVIIRVVSECNEPYVKKNDDVVGAGIPRSSETEPDVEVRQDLDENLKKILEKLKESIRKGKRDE